MISIGVTSPVTIGPNAPTGSLPGAHERRNALQDVGRVLRIELVDLGDRADECAAEVWRSGDDPHLHHAEHRVLLLVGDLPERAKHAAYDCRSVCLGHHGFLPGWCFV